MIRRFVCAIVSLLLMQFHGYSAETSDLPKIVEFNRDIRPILSDNCVFCHGPDKNKRQADLRLDTEDGLIGQKSTPEKPGVVIAGKASDSELIRRVISSDQEQVMPPIDSGKKLTAREIELLKLWVEQGARYEGHWAFLPIRGLGTGRDRAAIGATNHKSNSAIDAVIRKGLANLKLSAAPEADRIMLIRRLSFDLIGLPPSLEQVDSFLNDKSAEAYERVVDRLLESPHFGERLAIWWLDLVRYADSVGYHGDQDVSVSPFRQYVIDSFNSNKRFDQFTVEQLAGDLLNEPTREQQIASGYNRLGMMSAEGGVQDKEYLAKYMAERVRNASGTWLGVTLGCAECHDHKYDPFTTRDFYRFEAFFADIQERGLYSGASSDGNWGSFIKVPDAEQQADLDRVNREIAATRQVLDTPTAELAAAQSVWETSHVVWTVLTPQEMTSANGATLHLKEEGSVLVGGTSPGTDTYTLTFRNLPNGITAIRLEVLPDDSLPAKGPGRAGNGNFVLSEFVVRHSSAAGLEQDVVLQNATASYEQTGAAEGNPYGKWAIAAAIDGDAKGKTWGWAVMEKAGQPHVAVFETAGDIPAELGSSMTIAMHQNLDNAQHTIGRFRISVTTSPRPVRLDQSLPVPIATILVIAPDQRSPQQQNELAAHYRSIAPILEPMRQQLAPQEKSKKELDARIPSTLVTTAVAPRMVRVLRRGNWMDETGDEVTPAYPAILSAPASDGARLTRLDLARWMTSAENPLTARVFVNRIWKLLFGAGLSRRVDDLGAQGDWPSHPQLLDQLASQFFDSGWDIKHLIKAIVMSDTYRQSSLVSPELREIDPYNRLLARQDRFRLDAELVRDNALAISGLLVTKLGGTSVKPYQPPGYWAHLNFPAREWQNGSGDDLYRRGLYTHWQRQYLHPSLMAFDAPSREECTADRARSNTPLQSLVLLNDPSYIEAARAFAEKIIRHGGDGVSSRLHFAFRRAVSRNISVAETEVLNQLFESHLADYKSDTSAASELISVGAKPAPADIDAAELAAWTSVARTILNLHETVTRN